MTGFMWFGGMAGAVAAGMAVVIAIRWQRRRAGSLLALACQRFRLRREGLEAKFVRLATQSGKPRGLSWADCSFADEVAFARDRATGQLRAFVAVTVRFEAIPDGGLEENPNVDDLREATAIFLFDGQEWRTDGRAIFNLSPLQTIEHFRHQLQLAK